jgi:hypothetical protein
MHSLPAGAQQQVFHPQRKFTGRCLQSYHVVLDSVYQATVPLPHSHDGVVTIGGRDVICPLHGLAPLVEQARFFLIESFDTILKVIAGLVLTWGRLSQQHGSTFLLDDSVGTDGH